MQVDPQAVRNQLIERLLPIAERIGNVRLDAITFGVSERFGNNTGYIVVVARGEYDLAAVSALLREELPADRIEHDNGTEIFRPDREAAIFFPSNERAVFIVGPRQGPLPIEALAAAVRAGEGELKNNELMGAVLGGIDRTQPLWAAMRVSDDYRAAPVIGAFDWIRIVGRHENDKALLEVTAEGSDAQAVQQAVQELEDHVQTAIASMEPMLQQLPMLEPYHAFFKSMTFATDDNQAKLTGTLPTTSPVGLLFPMFGVSHTVHIDDVVIPQEIEEIPDAE